MGYRARWLAVKNGDLAAMLKTLGLRRVSEQHEHVYDPGFYALSLPDAWTLVIGDGGGEMKFVPLEAARALSAETEALHFYCDDSSMRSSLIAFRDGKEAWALEHDDQRTDVRGAIPRAVEESLARGRAQQAATTENVDYVYDVPAESGLALIGFRHDQTLGDGTVLPILVLDLAH